MVQQTVVKPAGVRQLGETLGAHFLLRGNLILAADGYTLDLAVIDTDTERALATKALVTEAGPEPTIKRNQINDALADLTYRAMQEEVARARAKPDSSLDVRDLTFRAYVDWGTSGKDPAAVYVAAQSDLDRALAMAPNDLVALRVTAEMNLCECARAWAREDRLKRLVKVGTKALDRSLQLDPGAPNMLYLRSRVFYDENRFEEAILVADDTLRHDPEHDGALVLKTAALINLHRLPEALAAAKAALDLADSAISNLLAAEIHYAMKNNVSAILHATKAISLVSSRDRGDRGNGLAVLILAAAQARSGNVDRAKEALKPFYTDVHDVRTIKQMKLWLGDTPDIDGEEVFAGLRIAGVSD